MHKIFVFWFKWGYWASIITLVPVVLVAVTAYFNRKWANIGGAISGCLYILNLLTWLVLGAIWRYSYGGAVASGDKLQREDDVDDDTWKAQLEQAAIDSGYQYNSGYFMKVYLMK